VPDGTAIPRRQQRTRLTQMVFSTEMGVHQRDNDQMVTVPLSAAVVTITEAKGADLQRYWVLRLISWTAGSKGFESHIFHNRNRNALTPDQRIQCF
jgi:hypothetical protein